MSVLRHIPMSGECPICHVGPEDVRHLLFECIPARELWEKFGVLDSIRSALHVDRSGSIVLEDLLNLPTTPFHLMPTIRSIDVIAVGCWYLWWIRRQATHNEIIPPPNRWPISVMEITGGYNKVSNQNREDTEHRWKRPGPKFVKVNVDAAFYQDAGAGATAAIMR